MKRILILAGLLIFFAMPNLARAGQCVGVSVTTASTKVLAANDLGSGGRHYLSLQITSTPTLAAPAYAWCNVGTTPVLVNAGIQLQTGYLGSATILPVASPLFVWPAVQLPARTFPIVPSGEVDCIATATQTVTACDY